jgi:exodeoxyribonuclease V alpha subunit
MTATPAVFSGTVVVDEILYEGAILVFRARCEDAHGGVWSSQVTCDGSTTPAPGRERSAPSPAVRCVAPRALMRAPAPGEAWGIDGEWELHPAYGPQVVVRTAALARPSGRLVVQAISRDAKRFPGLGVSRANALWQEHGVALFGLLDAGDPTPFVEQLGTDLAAVLVTGWRALDQDAKAYRWLTEHGFAPGLSKKIMAIYGTMPVPAAHVAAAAVMGPVVWHLEDDPYRMLAFASWQTVDAAARRMGLVAADPRRRAGAVEAACARALTLGHTYLPAGELSAAVARLLSVSLPTADATVAQAAARGVVTAHAGGYQLPGTHIMEQFVERRILSMHTGRCAPAQIRLAPPMTRARVEELLDAFDASQATTLTHEQRDAVWMAVTERISLLLGGPGVGKTTVLKAVHHVATAQQQTVHQAALAGRAARRMSEATGRTATTIMGLQMAIDSAKLVLDDEPLVVIDEASMCDLATVYRLLRRFPDGVRVLLVGDPGQLPPIGFGLTFHVFARAADIPRTTLTQVMRQTAASGIPAVCTAIREGRVPSLDAPDWNHLDGVSFIDAAPDHVTDTVIDVLARVGGVGAAQVVGSVKRGPGGTIDINARLQALCGPPKTQLNGHFYAGDPVIATRNDAELGVLNGDLGVAVSNAEAGGLLCRFDAGDIEIPTSYLFEHLELAYAITTHKAQGSEFPCVIIPVTPSRLLDRTLLLTAVSRAQRQAILIGDRALFARAVAAPATPDLRLVGLGMLHQVTPPLTLTHP